MTVIYILYIFLRFLLFVLFIVSSHPIPQTRSFFSLPIYIMFIRMGGDPTEGGYMVTKASRVKIKYGCHINI